MIRQDDPFTAIEKRSLEQFRPLRAMLELTYRCNFRCVHCYLVEFRSPGVLTTDELRSTMEQLAQMGCMVLTLTGGEPLVRRDFFEIADIAKELRFALRIFTPFHDCCPKKTRVFLAILVLFWLNVVFLLV